MLAAPGRFSTRTGTPQPSFMRCASSRPSVSTDPPGANGTTMRIGLSGYLSADCACAVAGASRLAAASAEIRNLRTALAPVQIVDFGKEQVLPRLRRFLH